MSADPSSNPLSAPVAVGLPAEVTVANAREVLEQSLPQLDAAFVRFDLSACRHFDSSLIGIMLELARRASAAGRSCLFTGASPNLRKLAGLYGVDALLFGEGAEPGAEAVRSAA